MHDRQSSSSQISANKLKDPRHETPCIVAPECYNGSINGERFEKWFKFKLIKNVQRGRTIIMDRTSFHGKKQLEDLCAKAKTNLLFILTIPRILIR
jgi:hypothetical protein